MIHRIEETTSTNDDARDAKYRHGDIVWAERQTAGRGQRGHKWSSAEGLNLTFSLVLEPRFLPAGEQFLLNEAVALALTDTFAQFGIAARIKWTNDIYAGDKKLVGILIEHSYSGQTLARTIVGIGINVNQTEFDPALPNPVSMAMVAGRTFDRGEVLEAFRRQIGIRYAQLELTNGKPSSATTANGCTDWANGIRSATPTARRPRPRSRACAPRANCCCGTPTARSGNICSRRSNS